MMSERVRMPTRHPSRVTGSKAGSSATAQARSGPDIGPMGGMAEQTGIRQRFGAASLRSTAST